MKDRTASSESEEISKNEQIMEQRLQTCHGILSRIQMASGCKDVNRICKVYMQGEETNLDLFEKVNGMSLEIEKLHEENATDKLRTEAQNLEDATDSKVEELESVKRKFCREYMLS
ncbi:hypothetical protein CEXT_666051 [Caerostris extrusa]|uniref:ODAD1 central coiled coil region domain-containing protein n=1 Tax=Caerostris extrusa TaxID=172846 RepID=A0AAV4QMR4_CAEEX|nr:hypothetical protein CEXT_666051 [Caerostris extrusa]